MATKLISERKRPWLLPLVLTTLVVLPLVELIVLVKVGRAIGALLTLALLIILGVLGTRLMSKQGRAAWQGLRTSLADGRMPTDNVADGIAALIAGLLLVLPGFITDALALLVLLPPTRKIGRRLFAAAIERAIPGATNIRLPQPSRRSGPDIIDGEVIDVTSPSKTSNTANTSVPYELP